MNDRQKANDNAYSRLMELQREVGGVPCEKAPELFFPEDLQDPVIIETATNIAKGICKNCPVLMHCRNYALQSERPYGIWGGLTAAERHAN